MDMAKLTERAAAAIDAAISVKLPASDRAAIQNIIQETLRDAADHTQSQCKEAVVFCCGPEADLAHKIQAEMDKKRDMLVANLMAMR